MLGGGRGGDLCEVPFELLAQIHDRQPCRGLLSRN